MLDIPIVSGFFCVGLIGGGGWQRKLKDLMVRVVLWRENVVNPKCLDVFRHVRAKYKQVKWVSDSVFKQN